MLLYLFVFSSAYMINAKIIKNIDVPACRNCIHYKPSILYDDYDSPFTKCKYFGEKNIKSNEITYKYADLCRENENKCGLNGKYFEEDVNAQMKFVLYNIIKIAPISLYIIFVGIIYYDITKK